MVNRRNVLLGICSAALGAEMPLSAYAQTNLENAENTELSWHAASELADKFVSAESPDVIWPFEFPDRSLLAKSARKVFCHYIPPFPLSIDNLPLSGDYYQRNYLQRNGEHDKYLHVGGYLRERPLSPGVWPNKNWLMINSAIEVFRAHKIGADGFGIDWHRVDHGRLWEIGTALLAAAEATKSGFRIVIEPDTYSLSVANVSVASLVEAVAELSEFPNAFRLPDGRLLLAPFAAEIKSAAFWQAVLKGLESKACPTALLPIFLNRGADLTGFSDISYGASVWGSRDPDNMALDALRPHPLNHNLVWMEPVVPQDARPKNSVFWEAANTELFRTCWTRAIKGNATYAHIITWNDYSECTEIAPSTGIQYLFYDLTAYYIIWFKLGHPPRIIRDAIYYCHRRQIFEKQRRPLRSDDIPLKAIGRTPLQNRVEMLALLTQPATLEVQISGYSQKLEASTGLNVLSIPAQIGRPQFRILRGGHTVAETQSNWDISDDLTAEDPLYVGGSNTRQFASSGELYR